MLVAALTAGDVQAAYTGGTTVLPAVAGGSDLKIVMTLTNRLGYAVVAAPSIKSAKDLHGKKSAYKRSPVRFGWAPCSRSSTWAWIRSATTSFFLVVGDQTVATQVLETGQIDMTVLDGSSAAGLSKKVSTFSPSFRRRTSRFLLRAWLPRAACCGSNARPLRA
ncbi:MAG TPA: ABC transporter substrate-binding protein [Candidatus Binatia bacterium]|nr:ABC transporter substrate-binding protein [Candidatus Binatia bacterium]